MWSLFGRGKQNKKLVIKKYNKKFVEIVGIDFFGSFSESSNCRYIVAWSDFDPSSGQGGFREDGFGTYILAENGNVIVIGKAERPNDGKVADNGTFILNDWLFGEGLRGSFLAFDRRGQSILRHNFSANLFNNDISHTGSYAVCQLCNSNTDESGMLAFFDLRNGTLLWKKVPETGWADGYSFDEERHLLTLIYYPENDEFAYNFDGLFLDKAKWERVFLGRANGFELHLRAKQNLALAKQNGDTSTLTSIQELLTIALQRGLEQHPNEQAAIYRTLGEIKEMQGQLVEALSLYETALNLNPKVGLKRKIAAMKVGHV